MKTSECWESVALHVKDHVVYRATVAKYEHETAELTGARPAKEIDSLLAQAVSPAPGAAHGGEDSSRDTDDFME